MGWYRICRQKFKFQPLFITTFHFAKCLVRLGGGRGGGGGGGGGRIFQILFCLYIVCTCSHCTLCVNDVNGELNYYYYYYPRVFAFFASLSGM